MENQKRQYVLGIILTENLYEGEPAALMVKPFEIKQPSERFMNFPGGRITSSLVKTPEDRLTILKAFCYEQLQQPKEFKKLNWENFAIYQGDTFEIFLYRTKLLFDLVGKDSKKYKVEFIQANEFYSGRSGDLRAKCDWLYALAKDTHIDSPIIIVEDDMEPKMLENYKFASSKPIKIFDDKIVDKFKLVEVNEEFDLAESDEQRQLKRRKELKNSAKQTYSEHIVTGEFNGKTSNVRLIINYRDDVFSVLPINGNTHEIYQSTAGGGVNNNINKFGFIARNSKTDIQVWYATVDALLKAFELAEILIYDNKYEIEDLSDSLDIGD